MTSNNTSSTFTAPSFVVTGFGPFRGVKDNPTTVIANKLVDYVKDKDLTVSTLVIETSAEAAEQETDRLKAQLQSREGPTVLLHLGVNYKGTHFQLEQCAYNEANFRIPDEKGFQPRNKKVIEGCEPTLTTTLDLTKLTSDLAADSIVVSTDPGRFVCNYTYYCSLSKFGDEPNVYSLFLHVPPFSVVNKETQLEVVTQVMGAIRNEIVQNSK